MITVTSRTTGQTREIPDTIEYNGRTLTYVRTDPQRNYRPETDWYQEPWTDGQVVGRQQPMVYGADFTVGT